jgi:hypothetical protein
MLHIYTAARGAAGTQRVGDTRQHGPDQYLHSGGPW